MSSNLKQPSFSPAGSRTNEHILFLLKINGPQTTSELAASLGITGEAARQQLNKLLETGLISGDTDTHGVGRPAYHWKLTPTGHASFPDAHSDLTIQLLTAAREGLGNESLHTLIGFREKSTIENYSHRMAKATTLKDRVSLLADIRAREGYMAEWHQVGRSFLLVENHCPICAAATVCNKLCDSELSMFKSLLGPGATVIRTEHITAGGRRCVYRITPDSI